MQGGLAAFGVCGAEGWVSLGSVLTGSASILSHCEQETRLTQCRTAPCVCLSTKVLTANQGLAPGMKMGWGSLASNWRLQKSLEVLDQSATAHGLCLPPPRGTWAGAVRVLSPVWDCVCEGTCVITAETSVKPSLRRRPCPLPAQPGARTLLSLPAVGKAGPRVAPGGDSSRFTRADSSA